MSADAKQHKTITFLDLPPELRNQVYKHALVTADPIELDSGLATSAGSQNTSACCHLLRKHNPHYLCTGCQLKLRRSICTLVAEPALTRVSRVLRHETLPIYYGANRFSFQAPHNNSDGVIWYLGRAIKKWLLTLGKEKRSMIKEMYVWGLRVQLWQVKMRSWRPFSLGEEVSLKEATALEKTSVGRAFTTEVLDEGWFAVWKVRFGSCETDG